MPSPNAIETDSSQLALLVVYADPGGTLLEIDASQTALLAAFAQTSFSKYEYSSQAALLTPYGVTDMTSPYISQSALMVVYAQGVSTSTRSRAWTFVLDGHTFYVLDLGTEGTFLYDLVTRQWSQFSTGGYPDWNMKFGTMWGSGRVAGGDEIGQFVWELNPAAVIDEGFRDLLHVATGGIATRNRVRKAVERFVITGSVGKLDTASGATISLRWSDDLGQTWSDYWPIDLTGDPGQEIAWRSLGAFGAPGRIFEISDVGGMVRIDGADVGIDNYDDDNTPVG